MASPQVALPLPVLPENWSGDKDFKSVGTLSSATQRNIEPVGPHFLAHARRVSIGHCCMLGETGGLTEMCNYRSVIIVPFPKMSGYKLKKTSRKSKMRMLVR